MAAIDNVKLLGLCYDALDIADRIEYSDPERHERLVTMTASLMSAVVFELRKRSSTLKPDMQRIYIRLRSEVGA